MPKLTQKTIRYGRTDVRTDGRTDLNYRKASLLTIEFLIFWNMVGYFFQERFILALEDGEITYQQMI